MACPSGCLNGGGQIKASDPGMAPKALLAHVTALYGALRRSAAPPPRPRPRSPPCAAIAAPSMLRSSGAVGCAADAAVRGGALCAATCALHSCCMAGRPHCRRRAAAAAWHASAGGRSVPQAGRRCVDPAPAASVKSSTVQARQRLLRRLWGTPGRSAPADALPVATQARFADRCMRAESSARQDGGIGSGYRVFCRVYGRNQARCAAAARMRAEASAPAPRGGSERALRPLPLLGLLAVRAGLACGSGAVAHALPGPPAERSSGAV